MLNLDGLTITQGDFTLSGDFALTPGQRYAVIGPSGSGKSTLLGALCGFVPLTRGRVTWKGSDLTDADPGARPFTMLFQDNNLFPHLSIEQNVGLGLRPDLRLTASDRTQVVQALARVGLAGMGRRKPGSLSGGQQSRAALARVLVQARCWAVLDEPFAALGPALRREMLALLREVLQETGAGLIMVTHSPEDARAICDQVIFVEGGVAAAPVPTTELFDNPPPALRAYLG